MSNCTAFGAHCKGIACTAHPIHKWLSEFPPINNGEYEGCMSSNQSRYLVYHGLTPVGGSCGGYNQEHTCYQASIGGHAQIRAQTTGPNFNY